MLKGHSESESGRNIEVQLHVEQGVVVQAKLLGELAFQPANREGEIRTAIEQVLRTAPIDSTSEAWAARIRAAIPYGVTIEGIDAWEIAAAVRAALRDVPVQKRIGQFTAETVSELTACWRNLSFTIYDEQPLSAALNVALDEVLSNDGSPSLRFWGWAEPAVIVGRCQSIANEIEVSEAEACGMSVVRRMSGGGTMFVRPEGAITYSLIVPEETLSGLSIRQSYEVCDAWVVACLRELGLDIHHVPVNDLGSGNGKAGGAAQARRRGIILHHTTLAYRLEMAEMTRVLRTGRDPVRAETVRSAAKVVNPLAVQTQRSREAIVESLKRAFQTRYGGTISSLSQEQLRESQALATSKYVNTDWTFEFP